MVSFSSLLTTCQTNLPNTSELFSVHDNIPKPKQELLHLSTPKKKTSLELQTATIFSASFALTHLSKLSLSQSSLSRSLAARAFPTRFRSTGRSVRATNSAVVFGIALRTDVCACG
uniref:(northern house mosquito) hypothetical protein n=1 Tax=Culex pipiens TaxID=7175 RepID=A0A8D8G2L2_CULPI